MRLSSESGRCSAISAVRPRLAATPIQSCCPSWINTPSSIAVSCTMSAVLPPDVGRPGVAICT